MPRLPDLSDNNPLPPEEFDGPVPVLDLDDGEPTTARNSRLGVNRLSKASPSEAARELFKFPSHYRKVKADYVNPVTSTRSTSGGYLIVNGDTGIPTTWKTVSKDYGIVQPSSFQIMDEVMNRCESFPNGGVIDRGGVVGETFESLWLQSKGFEFEGPNGPIETRMTVIAGFNGSRSWTALFDPEEIWCKNMLRGILGRTAHRWTVPHTKNASEIVEDLTGVISKFPQKGTAIGKLMKTWGRKKVSSADVLGITRRLFPTTEDGAFSKGTARKVDLWRQAFEESPGAKGKTLLDVAAASSFYGSHLQKVTSDTTDVVFENLLEPKLLQEDVLAGGNWTQKTWDLINTEIAPKEYQRVMVGMA